MPYRPKSPQEPHDGAATAGDDAANPQSVDAQQAASDAPQPVVDGPTKARKTLWLVGLGVGVYFIATGIYQAIMAGQS